MHHALTLSGPFEAVVQRFQILPYLKKCKNAGPAPFLP